MWIEICLLGRMDNKRLRAYARALDPMMREAGKYRVEWLTLADFTQLVAITQNSSKTYPRRRMGALRFFFAFLHDLALLDDDDVKALDLATYAPPEKGGAATQ